MSESDAVQKGFLAATLRCADAVLRAPDEWPVYEAASAFADLASTETSSARTEDGHPRQMPTDVYLVWSALTDRMDAPGWGGPNRPGDAVAAMKRAASEWLESASSDEARTLYLDHWKHVECGYER